MQTGTRNTLTKKTSSLSLEKEVGGTKSGENALIRPSQRGGWNKWLSEVGGQNGWPDVGTRALLGGGNEEETSDSDSDEEPKVFHEENLVIISSNEKISMNRWRIHLKNNWERLMKENTQLLRFLLPLDLSNTKNYQQYTSIHVQVPRLK